MNADRFTALQRWLELAASRRSLFAGLAAGMLAADPSGIAAKQKGKKKRKKRNKKKDRPQTRADAQCAGSTGSSVSLSPDARVAQTFTALRSGTLMRAELELSHSAGTSGDYFLQLAPVDAFGVPTNAVLADAAVASAQVPDGASTVRFPFPQPARLVAGDRYALVLSRPGVGPQWDARSDDGCAGGSAFVSADLTASFQALSPTFDFIFATFVRS